MMNTSSTPTANRELATTQVPVLARVADAGPVAAPATQPNWKALTRALRELGDTTLPNFLSRTELELEDLYRRREGWTALRRSAGFQPEAANPAADTQLGRAFGRMLHINDAERLNYLRTLPGGPHPDGARGKRLLAMADAALWGGTESFSGAEDRLAMLHEARAAELHQLAAVLGTRLHTTQTLDPVVPLHLHAFYSKNEVLAAFGVDKPAHMREGVKYVAAHHADLFFVTIQKTENQYKASTRYQDQALGERIFQWESQSTLRAAAATAQRYISGQSIVHLLIRHSKTDQGLGAPPYLYAGPMRYVSHQGELPIRFVWQLDYSLPPQVLRYAMTTAG
ncbi:DUF3427 domain-containing protein [Sphaerisporangium album]|uniref:DUF3427 domain-containing protein n=1 Tax=Sphaerisporangium album TaxID=509200 RepID=A0A367ESZ3_9ACTN|nr:DUF3427 domain-containing protein [Sphaerisporangium album]RCG21113.1 DUF3427 domain-containing protein [Sphaerisporangium album]